MAVLPLVYYGNPVLKKKSREVKDFEGLPRMAADMLETMYLHKGVGLAAVQVNRPIRVFVMNAEQDAEKGVKGREEVFVNPVLLKLHGKELESEEGCLCTPEVHEMVKRKSLVDIEYLDLKGEKHQEKGVSGPRARIMQHETDHLDGMLFVDRISIARKLLLKRELNQIAKDYS